VQLQVFRHAEFSQIAQQHQQMKRAVLAPRGPIYDSNMDELATAISVSTVVAEPRRIANIHDAAAKVAGILGLDAARLEAEMKAPAHQSFMVIQRRIDPRAEQPIENLRINGLYLVDESMRAYPNRNLASHVLGFVNMNGDGGAGLELEYDSILKGTIGQISFDVDAYRRSFRGRVEKPAVPGHSLVLSLDRNIQFIAESELAAATRSWKAIAGIAIVMESDTGRILAMAGQPDFNNNKYNAVRPELWRNRAISDVYEPGSTFKVVVSTAALEAGLTRPNEMIDCQMGTIFFGKHAFHDHKPYGLLSFNQILEYSSNIGAAKLGLRLGEERLYTALRAFGFGSKTGIDLPGEIVGLVRSWHQWSGLSIGAISFGQEVGVTSIQILNAINAIANGGYLVRPFVVDRIIDPNGDLVFKQTPQLQRIMKPDTAETVRNAFEGVILRGTGTQAALEGYRAAGKTGTAQKIIDGHYSKSKYLASFIGFAPLPHPKITVLVQIDEPKGAIYGGSVAAPVFQKIAQQVLLRLKVPPDQPMPSFMPRAEVASNQDYAPPKALDTPAAAGPAPAAMVTDNAIIVTDASETITVPDFRGMAKRAALNQCLKLGIQLKAIGSGIAVFQAPPLGTTIPRGSSCSITFARGLPGMRVKTPGPDAALINRNIVAVTAKIKRQKPGARSQELVE
jgi:cell division protein FtsI (penicillin-binding protein 3)